ncbi:trichohyalin-like [Paramacrobiotus metropolitanus]|uniref:trichohyalin-like n=1 Tax=Paramacrobiotus metropolitanus TaxID=2943436 RepID=UPI00244630BA|nr:trichohyalin-like [Paramacrobiotus metropolitanus]
MKGKSKVDICKGIVDFFQSNGVNDRTWQVVKDKITALENGWRKANLILDQTGEGDDYDEKLDRDGKLKIVKIKERVLHTCKFWDELDPVFSERPGNVPPYVGNTTETVENALELMFPAHCETVDNESEEGEEQPPVDQVEQPLQVNGYGLTEDEIQLINDQRGGVSRTWKDRKLDGEVLSDDSADVTSVGKSAVKRQKVDLKLSKKARQKQRDPIEVLAELDEKKTARFEKAQQLHEEKNKLRSEIEYRQLALQEEQMNMQKEQQLRQLEIQQAELQMRKEQQERQAEYQKEELAVRRLEAENRRMELELQMIRAKASQNN